MPLKKRLVNRDGFYGRNFIFALEADDPVNHQKRVAMRKDVHHLASVQTGIAPNDNRVFEAAALDQVLLHEWLNILVVNKCSCRRDLALEARGGDFHR